jgi:RimJ/RimL family protein N-acetyltransferase
LAGRTSSAVGNPVPWCVSLGASPRRISNHLAGTTNAARAGGGVPGIFRRFATEPGLVGLDWSGFRDAQASAKQFAIDGYLGPEHGRLMVQVVDDAAGFVTWTAGSFDKLTKYWEIGISLQPEWRGHGLGWRAQAMLCDYLFMHTPVQRIQAATHPENIAEQKSLEKAGFQLEGVIRAAEFRAGEYCDGYLYSRLPQDPKPSLA